MMAMSFFIFLVLVNRHISVTAGQACSSDQSEHDGSCYYFSPSKVNFDSSKSSCEALGMHLVYIGSQEEQNFLQNSLSGTDERHWIGLSKLTWLDESSLTYNNFANSDWVFNDGGTCFRIFHNSFWYDGGCSNILLYICEKEKESSAACDSGQTEYDGSCYFFSPSESDFSSSKSSCEELGMHLVYIGSQEEQEFLVDNRPNANSRYWIGLSRVTWLDGSSLTYSYFAYDDSKAFDEEGSCFVIEKQSESFKWIDDNCAHSHTHLYICEKERRIQTSSVQQTTPPTEQTTDITPATTTTKQATQMMSTCSSKKDRGNSRSKNFKLLFNNVAIIDAFVRSSHAASSLIQCSQWCLRDTHCSCFTFISSERLCLLGEECPMFADIYEERHGAKTYSTVHEDRECFSENENHP